MKKTNRSAILETAAELFARTGQEEFSIRRLAKAVPITPSVIYHYFKNEDDLLRAMFDYINLNLGQKRANLPVPRTATKMLKQRIEFQLDNAQSVVALLKYYLAYRRTFPKVKQGFVPDKSSLHIEEVLRYGLKRNEFTAVDIENDAKVITHAINGFLLEYYPHTVKGKEKKELIERIYTFLIRGLKGGKEIMKP